MDLRECARLLRERDRYLIVTHTRPDGDTLGSAAALCRGLRRLGKTAHLYHNPEITGTYAPFVAAYLAPEGYRWDTAVSVDVGDAGILARGFSGEVFLMLDHHATGEPFARHVLRQTHRASCGELILDLLEALELPVDKEQADLLYMAVSTDTGCFRYANTTAETFFAAGRLARAGADVAGLNKLLFRTKSRPRLTLEGLVYSGLRSYRDGALNVAVITLEMMARAGAGEADCDDLASLAGQVEGNRVAVTVRELSSAPPLSKISLRTDGGVDASAVCGAFGGGGHRMAAGCELALPGPEAAEAIRQAVEAAWA